MRFLNAEFIGYIGFKNGMGLDRICIDFTKGRNNIVLISGMNGSGKSTLLSHLNIFPDPSSAFTPGIPASKKFTIQDNDIIYNIQIFSDADSNGGRKTTKAFIQKNGIELNSNGNVSSYKDIIYSEFELDTNYMTLSHLSNDGNKGLGSLTPAERKKFTANIMENLEVYNEMYKTLSKKSSVYKTYINNLHSKMQAIGSKDYIESTLKQLREKEHKISVRIMELNNTIITIQAKCSIDEEEAKKIEELKDAESHFIVNYNIAATNVNNWHNKTKIKPDDIQRVYNEDLALLNQYNTDLETSKTEWINLSNTLNTTTSNIQSLEAELNMYQEDDTIEAQYNQSKDRVNELVSSLNKYGIKPDTNLINPLTNLLKVFDDFIKLVDTLYYDIAPGELDNITIHYDPEEASRYQQEIQRCYERINVLTVELTSLNNDFKFGEVLEKRPKNCKVDNCPFIKEAVEFNKKHSLDDIEESISNKQKELMTLTDKIVDLNRLIEICQNLVSKHSTIDKITNLIDANMSLLNSFDISILTDREKLLTALSNANQFNNIRDPKDFRDALNDLISYESEYRNYEKLSIQYNNYKDKMKLIDSNNRMLSTLKDQQSELLTKVNISKNNFDKYTELCNTLSNKVDNEFGYKTAYESYLDYEKQRLDIEKQKAEYNAKVGKSAELLYKINEYKDSIDKLTQECKPISDEISKLTGQLTMLESYYEEYNVYKSKFDMIETLKKYCSPTSGGIQVLFMQIYMSQTLEMSNKILSMLFNNEYRLLDFVINQNEFRIPFIGNGLPVDDISGGSSSQVCMMSMIINLVLLHQASTKFNIARLDEIDDSLDTYNRSNFVNVLYRILPLLNIEQLFIISHSIELDSSFADIIKLKSYDDYETSITGNIIWNYKDNI